MNVSFSRRTAWDLAETDLALLATRLRAEGRELTDLTESNPTRVGLQMPGDVASLIGQAGGARYAPHPLGLLDAREALAASETARGRRCDPARMLLSASTSEAYAWLFKLLCDPGDEVLVPSPSYPLFSYLADVESVGAVSYPLVREEGFRVDLASLEQSVGPRTRAIVLVNPNNPTGTFAHADDVRFIEALAAQRGVALVVDEVFGDFGWSAIPAAKVSTLCGERDALTFVLSGLSKALASPQLKLAWTAIFGPVADVSGALARLEVIADTFLSVSTPVQAAIPAILERRDEVVREVLARVTANLASLDDAITALGAHAPVRRLGGEGGWSAIIEVPRSRSDDEWVRCLALEDGLLVHPGYFFGLEAGSLVVSLLPEARAFAAAALRLAARTSEG